MFAQRHEIRDNSPRAYNSFSIAFLFVLSALLMLRQLASSSYFTVVIDDAFIYPSWAWQFNEALKEGTIYPRWLPLNFWGYGSPTFLLYPPLAYYMVAFFNLFTGSIIAAMNLVKLTALFLSGTGTYFLVKEFYPARVALLSAVFCIILPFNIALMYCFGSFAATASCLWFAPILIFIHKYRKTGEYKYLLYSGVCYGSLILTHLIIAYIFTFVIIAFAVCMVVIGKRARDLVSIPVVLMTGLALSAAYVLPVIVEKKSVNLETFTLDSNAIIYSNMFILPDMTARFAKGYFWPIYYNTMVLHTAIFCLFILIVCLIGVARSAGFDNDGLTHTINRFFLLTATISIVLMFGISSFVWENVPFFKYILFPARWMHITAFAAAFLSAALFLSLDTDRRTEIKRIILPALILTSCIAWDFYYITVAPSFDKRELFPAIAVNSIMEHLPKGVDLAKINKQFNRMQDPGFSILGEGSASVISWKSAERVIDIQAEKPLVIRFRTFDFPGWHAFVDGEDVKISTEKDTLAIMVNVPNGSHRVELLFKDTPVRRLGKMISLSSFLIILIYLARGCFMRLKN